MHEGYNLDVSNSCPSFSNEHSQDFVICSSSFLDNVERCNDLWIADLSPFRNYPLNPSLIITPK